MSDPDRIKTFFDMAQKLQGLADQVNAKYSDPTFPERRCDFCGLPYRGPAVYCSLECALADA